MTQAEALQRARAAWSLKHPRTDLTSRCRSCGAMFVPKDKHINRTHHFCSLRCAAMVNGFKEKAIIYPRACDRCGKVLGREQFHSVGQRPGKRDNVCRYCRA